MRISDWSSDVCSSDLTVIVYRLSSASTPTSTRKVMAGSGSVSKSSGNAAAFGRTYLRTTGAENTPPPERQPMANDELIERLRGHATDLKGDPMPGLEERKSVM